MGLMDKAFEQSQINTLDSSDVKDLGEACNELDTVRKAKADKAAEIKKLEEREFVLTFGRGQDSDATNIMNELQDRGLYPSNKKAVAWNTLSKLVEEQISKGSMSSADQEKFGVYTYKKVKIERKK